MARRATPHHPRLALLALAFALLAPALTAPAASDPAPEGEWHNLGEDGLVWVPYDSAGPTYLPPPDLGSYHNPEETAAALQALATARPDLVTLQTIGTSVQGRPILMATVTAPGDATGRARVLFDGAHHGDEVIAAEILTRWAQRAVAEYDTNATMRAILGATVVDVVPMVNPDGIAFVPQCSFYAQCRKNARGVDLNRNYEAHWGEGGSSGSPSDPTYRGPAPLSEPESSAIAALMDARDYALYASLHSGAEMILWPYGWTTSPPPEQGMYNTLGGELSALTGAPHGQVSRILYTVSGDSMDQAYVASDGWRTVAVSPETYEGSGTGSDWWYLFNPPETQINATVARWEKFLWHLAQVAPLYAPATLSVPESLDLGPGMGELSVQVTAPARRPFQGASLLFQAAGAPVSVRSQNPLPLANASGTQAGTFLLQPARGGAFDATVQLSAGPAGTLTAPVHLDLVQVGFDATVADAVMESPDTNSYTVTVSPGPFDLLEGTLTVRLMPEDVVLATQTVSVAAGDAAVVPGSFSGRALGYGNHTLQADLQFTAWNDGVGTPGALQAIVSFFVERPGVALDKRFTPASDVGEPLLVTAVYRNVGTKTATDLVVRETVPAGYLYTTRDGPVPVPPDPLGRPAPSEIVPRADGGVDLVWRFGNLAPGQVKFAQYRLIPAIPGEHALPSAWTFQGAFAAEVVSYEESAAPTHTARMP